MDRGFPADLPGSAKTSVWTIVSSLAAAGVVILFMSCMNGVFHLLYGTASRLQPWKFLVWSLVFTLVTSGIVALLLKKAPAAAGSGIPQAKAAYWKELGYIPLKTVFIKFIAGCLSIGGGASLGREGPSVYLGSGIASWLAGISGAAKRNRRAAAAIGASAGLAAAFNTPLAAITFSIEELINDLNTRYLGRVVLASLFGALAVQAILGSQPAFSLPHAGPGVWQNWILIPLTAFLASSAGILFQKATLDLRLRLRTPSRIPMWLNPVLGGLFTWMVGAGIYLATGKIGIFGLGYNDLSNVLHNGAIWWVAALLLVGKLLATTLSYSFGGCGGIFSPILFIGGMCGAMVAAIAVIAFPTMAPDHIILATVGMSACLGAVIRAPLTSTLIVFEMTHQFEIIPGLMVSAVVSQLVARAGGCPHNFYDELLMQDGHELQKIKPPRDLQSWQDSPVSQIMTRKPVMIQSLDPESLKRTLANYPYQCFPYLREGKVAGILTRSAIIKALASGAEPEIAETRSSTTEATVREASDGFISSPHGFLVIQDSPDDPPAGILTMHDLLRAQVAATE